MIEVNLYSIPVQDSNARMGSCIARNRFDHEAMGVGTESFLKGFLKDNISNFEGATTSAADLVSLLNSDTTLTRKDFSCINYYLNQIGYKFVILNVADDEDNALGVEGDVIEWNVIDHNYIQYDYPTATKIIPGDGADVISVLHNIVENSGLFSTDKFAGMKNPFTELFTNLDKIKSITGGTSTAIVAKIYELLEQCGIEIFCATSES